MLRFGSFRIGEVSGGAILICPACGHDGWWSGYIGGDTIFALKTLADAHVAERHAPNETDVDLGEIESRHD